MGESKVKQLPSVTIPKDDVFLFEALPIELKHEVLNKLKTGFLEDVCSLVSLDWGKMVRDIVGQRILNEIARIPLHIQFEISQRTLPNEVLNSPAKMLRMFERSTLRANFDVTSILVNNDCLGRKGGMIYKILKIRSCDCQNLDECIVRSLHVMCALELMVVQTTRALKFFHLRDLESLEAFVKIESIKHYECESDASFEHSSGTDISVFKDQIVAEESAKAILLLKVSSCDHRTRSLRLDRIRRVFLPIWSMSLCLLERKFYVLYSTGFVGMWDQSRDELRISSSICGNSSRSSGGEHASKMHRIGELVFIKTVLTNTCSWYVIDSKNDSIEVHSIQMAELVTRSYLNEGETFECTEVFYFDLWYNCFIVHGKVRSLINGEFENRLMVQRILRQPTISDFKNQDAFSELFSKDIQDNSIKSVVLNGCAISPFFPLSLQPWLLEPDVRAPIPVVDMISVFWTMPARKKRQKLKVYRIRVSNLPAVPS